MVGVACSVVVVVFFHTHDLILVPEGQFFGAACMQNGENSV